MNLPTGRHWGRLLAGALLALLAGVLSAPSAARASCGNYVHIDGDGAAERAAGTSPAPEPMPALPNPRPCTGPHCSRGAPLPLPPPVTVAPIQVKDLAWVVGGFLGTDDSLRSSLHEFPVALPQRHGRSIYHPPRPLF